MNVLTIFLLACVTFGTRYLFLEGRIPLRLGSNIKQLLSYSGPSVLVAICTPIIFVHDHRLDTSLGNPYLWGAAVAILAGYKTAFNIYWCVGAGILAFVVVDYQG